MIVGARKFAQSIEGWKISGDAGPWSIRRWNWSSTVNAIAASHAAQRERMVAVTGLPDKRPCTKGVTNASSAQAP